MNKNLSIILNIILAAALVGVIFFSGDKTKNVAVNQGVNVALENIFGRKSVRNYTDQKVSREQLDTLVRAAMSAPTAVNKRPWAFVIVDNRAVLDSLCAELPYAKMLGHASCAVVICGDTEKALLDKNLTYWVQDCSAATENLLLAAEAIGLGAVWTGVFPRMDRVDAVSKILKLPTHVVPLNVIPIGYPSDPNEPAKDKYNPEIVHFNVW